MWCLYNDHCLDIVIIIWSSINYPTVICLPSECYIYLRDLFLFAFIFRSINPKTQKYLAAIFIYLFYLAFPRNLFIQSTTILPIFYLGGIDNPSFTSGCKYLFFVCRYRSRSVAWFSYWFDNLVLITEGNTYRRCAASSLPLWGNTDVVQAASKGISGAIVGETSSTSTRFLITNLISLQFILFAICRSFSSPPLHKKIAVLFSLFLVRFSHWIFVC